MDAIVTWTQVERTSPWGSMYYRAYLCCTAESTTRVVVTMVSMSMRGMDSHLLVDHLPIVGMTLRRWWWSIGSSIPQHLVDLRVPVGAHCTTHHVLLLPEQDTGVYTCYAL